MVVVRDMEKIPECDAPFHRCPCYSPADMYGGAYCRMKWYLHEDYWTEGKDYPCPFEEIKEVSKD